MGSGVIGMLMLYFTRRFVSGTVIGKTPFPPINFINTMTHQGLEGDDMSEVGLFFVYSTLTMGLRGLVSKLLGQQEGPRLPMDYQVPKWMKDL